MPDHPLAARVKLRGEALEAAAVRGGEGRRVHVVCDFMHPLRELGHGLTTGGPWHWVPCSYSGTAPREAPLTFLTPLQVGGPCGGRENGSHGTQALSVSQQRAPRTMGVQCCSLTIRLPAIRLRTGPSSSGKSLWGRQQLIRLTGARRSPVSPFPGCGPRLPSLKSEGRRDPAVC